MNGLIYKVKYLIFPLSIKCLKEIVNKKMHLCKMHKNEQIFLYRIKQLSIELYNKKSYVYINISPKIEQVKQKVKYRLRNRFKTCSVLLKNKIYVNLIKKVKKEDKK